MLGLSIPTCFYVAYRNNVLEALLRRVLYYGHSTQYSHLVDLVYFVLLSYCFLLHLMLIKHCADGQ